MREGSKFTDEQWLEGLIPEVTSARNVLASADRLLRQEGPLERDLDAVLATYSIGVERLMKLALGTAAVSRGEGWPKMTFTREGWGHALDEMDGRLRDTLRTQVAEGTWEHKVILASWTCTLDNDPVWAAVISTLRNYADAGRYHHLDQIRGSEVKSRSSLEMWDEIERVAIAHSATLSEHHGRALVDFAVFHGFEVALRNAIADSIKRWVSIVCLFGFHGVLGEDWRAIGADALPDNALPVHAMAECEEH